MTDQYPISQRLTLLWMNWRAVIRNDPALKENLMFAVCAVVFLLGMWMGAR